LTTKRSEVRAAAVDVVAVLRIALGITEPVLVRDVMSVLDTNAVCRLAKAADIPMERGPGVDGVLATLRKLAAAGKVPLHDRWWSAEEMRGLRQR
jgi:hypothetical protein